MLFWGVATGLAVVVPASAQAVEQQKLMSVLTLNLARFTDWPEAAFADEDARLNLCVIGGSLLQQSFEEVNNTQVNGRTLQVINLSRLRNMERCQILYVSGLEQNILLQLLLEMKHKPLLTIGENLDFVRSGGMVALETVDGKIQLNINLDSLKQSGLVISSRILKLARIIQESDKP